MNKNKKKKLQNPNKKLFSPKSHENLHASGWRENQVKKFIKKLIAEVERQFSEKNFWPLHPRDHEFSVTDGTIKGLYAGASGVIWALEMLSQKGLVKLTRNYYPVLEKVYKKYLENPDTGTVIPSIFAGEVGILMLAYKFEKQPIWAQCLYKAVLKNTKNPSNEFLFGAPGTMLGALFMYNWTQKETWKKLLLENIECIFEQWHWNQKYKCWLWTQNLYGSSRQFLGAGHGFMGNIYALLQAQQFLSSEQGQLLSQRCIEVVKKFIVVDGPHANLPIAPKNAQMMLQWCHGAPGLITSLSKFPHSDLDEILIQAGELIWQAGPLTKGCSLCHGTDGNGYAFLALYQRTGQKKWLDRARFFAMHAIKQAQDAWKIHKIRFSLWTGDLGLAMFLADCLHQEYSLPALDKI